VIGLDATLLDPHVEHECTARYLLAVAAVAGVHDQRRRRQPVPHCAAGASSLQIHLHPPRLTLSTDLAAFAVLCSKKTASAYAKNLGKSRFLPAGAAQ
jgi:hypothetical protein